MARILIVDDDSRLSASLARRGAHLGHDVVCAGHLGRGLAICREEAVDVVLLDNFLPDGSGLEAVRDMREMPGHPEVIVMTGNSDPDGAERAIRTGAWDYIDKAVGAGDILPALETALRCREEVSRSQERRSLDLGPILGESSAIRDCYAALDRAAICDSPVLVSGETGTGKELFARAIHDNSGRSRGPFVPVDCASLTESLVESTLFGHDKGAYTGATRDSPGLVLQADGGTLFLDEIGELPLTVQGAFLRVLQERRFRPVGGRRERNSDFRLVAATNRDLDEMVAAGRFRQDLLFRLRALDLVLPPLRNRTGDVSLIVENLLPARCGWNGVPAKLVSPAFLATLERYPWPGNVRELLQVLDAAIVAAIDQDTLFPIHLPANVRVQTVRGRIGRPSITAAPPSAARLSRLTLREVREAATAAYLNDLASATHGDIGLMCQRADISRSRLYTLLRRHGVERGADSSSPTLLQ